MIKIPGSLFIRSIKGRNGAFSVGRLVTTIGEFAVKDTLLDQYEEGRYEGEFVINRIYPSYYTAGGRMVVEVRANLDGMMLNEAAELLPSQAEPPAEPDPIDVDRQAPASEPEPVQAPATTEESTACSESKVADTAVPDPHAATNREDEALFGTLWPLDNSVKLDTTVDRAVFRRQKERLKGLGYRFQPLGQIWVHS